MPAMPVIAIVGRPNVGKSSLLNALVGKRISIVQDMPGVTRDRISFPWQIDDHFVELVDTGGYGFVDPDALTEHIKHQIELAMSQAQLALFIVDCQDGLTSADEQIAALLRRKSVPTLLLANKADSPKADVALGDFARLGLGTPVGVSAATGRNLDRVPDLIVERVDLNAAPKEIPPPQMMVAIVGKRNAGKSTLVNAIAEVFEGHGDRVIVSEVPGTTRDSIDIRFEKDGQAMVVIDTAGVRKKRHMVTNDIEFYSFHRAQRSIRRADVVILLIDGSERISEPDQKLSQYINEQHKPVLVVINKWDKVLDEASRQAEAQKTAFSLDLLMSEYREYVNQELRHLDYVPMEFITAKDGKKVQTILDAAQRLFNQSSQRVTTGRLNDAIGKIMEDRVLPTTSGRRPKVYYSTQTDVNPPTIVLFVNRPEMFNDSYKRYMINRMREMLPFSQVPIRLMIRGKEGAKSAAARSPGGSTPAPERSSAGLRKAAPAERKRAPSAPKRARPARATASAKSRRK